MWGHHKGDGSYVRSSSYLQLNYCVVYLNIQPSICKHKYILRWYRLHLLLHHTVLLR